MQMNIIKRKNKGKRIVKVRFPSMAGDENREITVEQLQEEYKNYLIIDPRVGKQVNLRDLANLENIDEVVAMPPIAGG